MTFLFKKKLFKDQLQKIIRHQTIFNHFISYHWTRVIDIICKHFIIQQLQLYKKVIVMS